MSALNPSTLLPGPIGSLLAPVLGPIEARGPLPSATPAQQKTAARQAKKAARQAAKDAASNPALATTPAPADTVSDLPIADTAAPVTVGTAAPASAPAFSGADKLLAAVVVALVLFFF